MMIEKLPGIQEEFESWTESKPLKPHDWAALK